MASWKHLSAGRVLFVGGELEEGVPPDVEPEEVEVPLVHAARARRVEGEERGVARDAEEAVVDGEGRAGLCVEDLGEEGAPAEAAGVALARARRFVEEGDRGERAVAAAERADRRVFERGPVRGAVPAGEGADGARGVREAHGEVRRRLEE